MADNVEIADNAGSGVRAATDKVTYSGDTADVQLVRPVLVTGSEGSKTVVDLPGDNTDGLLVNLGTNNDVVVSSIAAGTNNIGDVDIVTVPAPLSTTGGGTEATALRVTLANDSTGVISIDDNSSSITVDNSGTFAVQATSMPGTAAEGAALPASFVVIAGDDGTDTQPLQLSAGGDLKITLDSETVAATQSGTWTLGANSGVDIGDVTINNSTGASAVNIQDGGNSITIDQATASSLNAQVVGNVASAATDSGNPIKTGAVYNTTQPTVTNGQRVDSQATSRGALIVAPGTEGFATTVSSGTITTVSTLTNQSQMGGQAIAMGTGVRSAGTQRVTIATDDVVPASQSGTWTVQPGNTANTTPWLVTKIPAASGGLTPHKHISTGTSADSTNVKSSAGQVYSIFVSNINAAACYFKLYNKASAPTVGTDTPVLTFLVPGNTAGAGFSKDIPDGIAFSSGIGYGITTAVADASTAAVAANEVVVNLGYK